MGENRCLEVETHESGTEMGSHNLGTQQIGCEMGNEMRSQQILVEQNSVCEPTTNSVVHGADLDAFSSAEANPNNNSSAYPNANQDFNSSINPPVNYNFKRRPTISSTKTIFAPKTDEMDSGFLMLNSTENGKTEFTFASDQELIDLTHLAPQAGDVCIPLDFNGINFNGINFMENLDDFLNGIGDSIVMEEGGIGDDNDISMFNDDVDEKTRILLDNLCGDLCDEQNNFSGSNENGFLMENNNINELQIQIPGTGLTPNFQGNLGPGNLGAGNLGPGHCFPFDLTFESTANANIINSNLINSANNLINSHASSLINNSNTLINPNVNNLNCYQMNNKSGLDFDNLFNLTHSCDGDNDGNGTGNEIHGIITGTVNGTETIIVNGSSKTNNLLTVNNSNSVKPLTKINHINVINNQEEIVNQLFDGV